MSILFSKKLLYVARQRALYVNHGAYSPVWPSRIEVHIQVRLGHGKHKSTTQTALARIHTKLGLIYVYRHSLIAT